MFVFKSDLFTSDVKTHGKGKILTYDTFVKMKDMLINLGKFKINKIIHHHPRPDYPLHSVL